jgi:hypothetical protein
VTRTQQLYNVEEITNVKRIQLYAKASGTQLHKIYLNVSIKTCQTTGLKRRALAHGRAISPKTCDILCKSVRRH